ncbi:MAG: hypothetical protein GXP24_11025 [Planctomycetes bacterium]|nr:hypothetical protein [Planctomycetota bacterium]
MLRNRPLRMLALGLAALLIPSVARAYVLVGVGFESGTTLVRIDPLTGQYTATSNLGSFYNSLAQNSQGEFYGGRSSVTAENGRVSRFDPATGAVLQTFNAITPGAGSSRGLSFDAEDNLFAVVNRNDSSGSPTLDDDLYRFDLASQTTTRIGSLGFGAVQGFDISPNDTFYAWDIIEGLLTVDPVTGNATDVNPSIGGTGDIQSIVFAPDGRLFGARQNLYRIDPTTGEFTQIGVGLGFDIRGIEFLVPEPSSGAILLSLLAITILHPVRKLR